MSKRMTVWVVKEGDGGFSVSRNGKLNETYGFTNGTFVCERWGRALFGSPELGIPQQFELTAKKLNTQKGKR